jgi:lipopolysaccharide export system protein LptA
MAGPQKTTVTSDRLEAHNTGVDGRYVFIGHVHITGTNLEIFCDRLEIFTESEESVGKETSLAESGTVRRVLATGNVSISQEGRKATCGTVEILPLDDRIILTENPIVSDIAMGVTMKGTRMTYHRGERDIEVENPEVIGPALPNLGFPSQSGNSTPAAPAPAPGAPTTPSPTP